MTKLNQLLAIEKTVKSKREDEFTRLYQDVQKGDLTTGFSKTYQAKDENGEQHPPQNKKVQIFAVDACEGVRIALTDIFNVVAQKDATNCVAKADVVVDGKTLLTGVPAVHLLFLEKRLTSLGDFIKKLPTLAPDETWVNADGSKNIWVTAPVETFSTKKLVKHNVVVPPTPQHPAQVKETTEDVVVGSWRTVKFSGALTPDRVKELSARVDRLTRAVKFAREEANQTAAVELKTGEAILGYVFG